MFKSHGKGGFKGGRGGGGFGGKGFKKSYGKKSFGGRDGNPQMHRAICDKCKQECEVPFKPTDDRPVYCNNCFKKPDDRDFSGKRESFGRKDFGGRSDSRSMGNANVGNGSTSGNSDQFKKQFDALNAKLDRIIQMLDPGASPEGIFDEEEENDEE